MKLIKLSSLVITLLLFGANINAQSKARIGDWCKTDENLQRQFEDNPGLIQQFEQVRQAARDYVDDFTLNNPNSKVSHFIIPTVVHNITHSGGQGYLSKADIEAAIDVMNKDYQRLNSDTNNTRAIFKPYAGSISLEFRLAHLDPNGDCTEGIVRLEHSSSADFSDSFKSLSYWNSKDYFNIWVVDRISGATPPSVIAGYAQFPASGINNTFGIVMDASFMGPSDRTLTHEVGHCFGLYHTFQSGCGGSCSNSGDYICDTPPVSTSTQGCNSTQNTCSNDASGPDPYGTNVVDQIENFMSYDACQNMFTLEQKATAEFYLNSTSTSTGLNQLTTASNLASTGTANPYNPAICAPIADFTYDKEYICEGGTVSFTDDSYNATPTSYSWIFNGGTPGTSSVANPTITYNTAGVYSVTHQPATTAGSGSETKPSIITVSSLTADYIGPIIDGFESTTQFNNDWWINNDGGQTWSNNTNASTTGNRSVRIRNYFTGNDGEVDELISPSFDISGSTTPTMTFKQAFAKKTTADTDKMLVYWSIDCGATWQLKLPLTVNNLSTAPDQSSVFTPGASDWVERTVSLSSISTSTNVRFKFAFTSGGGNDIYIDDINIGGFTVGLEEFSNIGGLSVYPNPTNSSAQISFNLTQDVKNLSIKVRNAVGQEVTSVINGQPFNTGKYTLKIDEERKLSSGIYFIEFNADDNTKVQKLIVQ